MDDVGVEVAVARPFKKKDKASLNRLDLEGFFDA
jgi:hypothetical protein